MLGKIKSDDLKNFLTQKLLKISEIKIPLQAKIFVEDPHTKLVLFLTPYINYCRRSPTTAES